MTVNESTPKGARRTQTRAARTRTEPAEQNAPAVPAAAAAQIEPSIMTALNAASDKKALAPVLLDLRDLASFTDYFLITSGTNQRQVQAIADEVEGRLKREGTRPARIEGYKTGEWVLLDYGDFIVHVFDDKARRFYDLERLWREAARIELPPEFHHAADSSLR